MQAELTKKGLPAQSGDGLDGHYDDNVFCVDEGNSHLILPHLFFYDHLPCHAKILPSWIAATLNLDSLDQIGKINLFDESKGRRNGESRLSVRDYTLTFMVIYHYATADCGVHSYISLHS